jgi:hypothetical protein
MGEPGTIAAYQHLTKVQHEVSDIGRHHGSGRSVQSTVSLKRVLLKSLNSSVALLQG